MNRYFGSVIGLCLFAVLGFAGFGTATAKGQTSSSTPPKILIINREFLKPGKSGSQHQKSESAFVQAFAAAKSQQHYLAMESLTGRSRAMFFLGYDTFANWENDLRAMQNDPTLAAALNNAKQTDGDLLSAYASTVFVFRNDLSLRAPVSVPRMRYMEITIFNVRPGHKQEFETLVKMYADASLPSAHWAAYEDMYGEMSGGRFIAITPIRSLAEIDDEMGSQKLLASKMTAVQMKKMADLTATAIVSTETNIFMFNPKMSYVSEKWKAVDPDFWGRK